jgi:hypothetical protein
MNDTSNIYRRRVDRAEFLDALYKAASSLVTKKPAVFIAGCKGRLSPKFNWANWTQVRFTVQDDIHVEFLRGRGEYVAFMKRPKHCKTYASYIVSREDAMALAVGQRLLALPMVSVRCMCNRCILSNIGLEGWQ